MQVITYVMIGFAVIAAVDKIIGNKLGLGKEFDRGMMMLGPLTISMTGMLIMAPLIAHLFSGVASGFPEFLDFSIVPAMLLANDMGGAPLAVELARDPRIGMYNAMVVSAMMGCTVAFVIPCALQMVDPKHHKDTLFGILCGIVTIPVGCLVSGLMLGIPFLSLVINLVPLAIFAGIIAFGLLKFKNMTVKILGGVGWVIRVIILIGLVAGIIEFLTGRQVIPYTDTMENAMKIVINIACIMAGAFPLIHVLGKVFGKPLKKLGGSMGVNETSALGLLATLGNVLTTFEMVDRMDNKGIVLNFAFAVSATALLVDHLAYTLSYNASYVPAVLVGKLISGVSAVVIANLLYNRSERK